MVVKSRAFEYSQFVDTNATDQSTARAAASAEIVRPQLRLLLLLRLARS
jgi:hypothetical protein